MIYENGSMGQTIRKQHPLCGLLYQQEMLCLSYAKGWNAPAYVAADNQQEAVDKVAPYYDTENPDHLTVEFVADMIV